MPSSRTKAIPRFNQVYYPKKSKKTAIGILKLLAKKSTSVLSTKQIAEALGSARNPKPHKRIKLILEVLAKVDYCTEYAKISNPDTRCRICNSSGKYLVEKTRLDHWVSIQEGNTMEYRKYEHEKNFDRSQWFICESGYVLGKSINNMKCFECGEIVGVDGFETKYKIHNNERYWSLSDNGIVVILTLLNNTELLSFYSRNPNHRIISCINKLYENYKKEWVDILIIDLKSHSKNNPNLLKIADVWLDEQKQRHTDIFGEYYKIDSSRSRSLNY